ncbi:MAG: hypothetical protein ACOX30_03020 [Dethiobacteria bacterium]
MIVSDRFKGDTNEALKWIQDDTYWSLLPYLYTFPKGIYRQAISFTGVETELYKINREIESFDHRVLQDAHDKIAAYYRYQHPDKLGQLVLPFVAPDCSDLSLEEILEKIYTREWCNFWYAEVRRISEEPLVVRAILTAVAYQNTDDGYEAEDLLMELLHDRYGKLWDTDVILSREYRKNKSHDTLRLPPEINRRLYYK